MKTKRCVEFSGSALESKKEIDVIFREETAKFFETNLLAKPYIAGTAAIPAKQENNLKAASELLIWEIIATTKA